MQSPLSSRFKGTLLTAVAFVLVFSAIPFDTANAAQITSRSLTLSAGASDGGSKPGGVVQHRFKFTIPNAGGGAVGSIKFQYCTTAANSSVSPTCVTPTGLSTTSSTLVNEVGSTGWTLNNGVNGEPYLSKASAPNLTAGTNAEFHFGTVTNPTTEGTFFVRITTHTATNGTGAPVDSGTVNASTAKQIILDGTMPESLVFCTGATVTTNVSNVVDCSTATAGTISFNQLFSPTDTATSHSQMAASTNAGAGYAITVNGPTLTSGSNTITGMTSSTPGVRGTAQFGLNLRANTTSTAASFPGASADVAPAPNGTSLRGQPTTDYGTVDNFKYVTGQEVARSDNGSAGGTDAQIFTVSYIANVPGSQPAGTYTTTLTYICTPTY